MNQIDADNITRFPTGPTTPSDDLSTAYAAFLTRISTTRPDRIRFVADEIDLEDRAKHVREILEAVKDYCGAVLADTKLKSWHVHANKDYVDGSIEEALGELYGAFMAAADAAREDHAA